jgi:hypothetical protein
MSRGVAGLAFTSEKNGDRRRKSDPEQEHPSAEGSGSRKKRGSTPEVGNALRSAYQQAINEDIPPEMLDLLGKLG